MLHFGLEGSWEIWLGGQKTRGVQRKDVQISTASITKADQVEADNIAEENPHKLLFWRF